LASTTTPEFTGYALEAEDKNAVIREAIDFHFQSLPMRDDAPVKYDPRSYWRMENQGAVGRCAGMASSSVGEACFNRQSGGKKVIQFNGHSSYIWAQQNSRGLYGRDRGSTIHGNVKAAKEIGFCPMDWDKDGTVDYPLPRRYTTDIPPQAKTYAAKYKIGYSAFFETFDEILAFLRNGQGGVFVGGSWGNWRPNAQGVADRFSGGGGGHAWCILGWDLSRSTFGEDVLLAANSHGTRSWLEGWCFLTRNFIKQFARHNHTVIAGMSDLTDPEPRKVVWKDDLEW